MLMRLVWRGLKLVGGNRAGLGIGVRGERSGVSIIPSGLNTMLRVSGVYAIEGDSKDDNGWDEARTHMLLNNPPNLLRLSKTTSQSPIDDLIFISFNSR